MVQTRYSYPESMLLGSYMHGISSVKALCFFCFVLMLCSA